MHDMQIKRLSFISCTYVGATCSDIWRRTSWPLKQVVSLAENTDGYETIFFCTRTHTRKTTLTCTLPSSFVMVEEAIWELS